MARRVRRRAVPQPRATPRGPVRVDGRAVVRRYGAEPPLRGAGAEFGLEVVDPDRARDAGFGGALEEFREFAWFLAVGGVLVVFVPAVRAFNLVVRGVKVEVSACVLFDFRFRAVWVRFVLFRDEVAGRRWREGCVGGLRDAQERERELCVGGYTLQERSSRWKLAYIQDANGESHTFGARGALASSGSSR